MSLPTMNILSYCSKPNSLQGLLTKMENAWCCQEYSIPQAGKRWFVVLWLLRLFIFNILLLEAGTIMHNLVLTGSVISLAVCLTEVLSPVSAASSSDSMWMLHAEQFLDHELAASRDGKGTMLLPTRKRFGYSKFIDVVSNNSWAFRPFE